MDGTSVYFEDEGGPGVPVVLYGGILDSVESVRASQLARALQEVTEFRLVYADHRGLGRSDKHPTQRRTRCRCRSPTSSPFSRRSGSSDRTSSAARMAHGSPWRGEHASSAFVRWRSRSAAVRAEPGRSADTYPRGRDGRHSTGGCRALRGGAGGAFGSADCRVRADVLSVRTARPWRRLSRACWPRATCRPALTSGGFRASSTSARVTRTSTSRLGEPQP